MSPDDLIGFKEVAAILGVDRSTAARHMKREDFPPPAATLAAGRVWRRGDVQEWREKNPPRPPGRPPKQT